jgi:hypothetical protein
MSRRITDIIIHHSAGNWGDFAAIDEWHSQRGWAVKLPGGRVVHCGYHLLVLNGFRTYAAWAANRRARRFDGWLQPGRPYEVVGAHCAGHNARSIGICLIGNLDLHPATTRQWAALVDACARLCRRYGLRSANIHGHREYAAKTCPGRKVSITNLRREVAAALAG